MTNEQIAVELTNHDDRLKVVEKGVSNFRNFQSTMNHRVGFVYGAVWVGGIVSALLLVVFGWALNVSIPVAKAIMDDYYRNHPAAVYHRSDASDPTEAKSRKYQDVVIPRDINAIENVGRGR